MIQITIDEHEPIGQFILQRAQRSGQAPEEAGLNLIRELFENTIRELHKRFMLGEFTQGELALMLGIQRIDLIHLLDDFGLPATNV